MPRLYTFIKALRSRDELPGRPYDTRDDSRFLLLDLGDSCAPEVWHCAVTGGRSALIVLDAMGYHAARVNLDAAAHDRLRANLLAMALVDDDHPWQENAILLTSNGRGDLLGRPYALHIVLSPAAETRLDGGTLSLAAVKAGQVGVVQVSNEPALIHHTVYDLPPTALPDPTITAAVDFVLSEARQLQRKP
ncbi:MAG: hypothetical protein HZC41_11065 [Chloroflexi bacterium]|nr:hypothetical protein [Chloroflexota bacterium]